MGGSSHSFHLNQCQNFVLYYSRRVGLRSDDLHQDTFDEISTGDVDVKTVAAVFHASLQHLEKTIIQAAKIIDYLDKLKLPDDHTKQERNAFKSSQNTFFKCQNSLRQAWRRGLQSTQSSLTINGAKHQTKHQFLLFHIHFLTVWTQGFMWKWENVQHTVTHG